MSGPIRIATVADADLDRLLPLNNAAVPAVNTLGRADLAWFAATVPHFRVAWRGADPAGMMIALGPGLAYGSPNYRWFEARYTAFLYVDRIVVDPSARSAGIGAALYDDLVAAARKAGACRLACEVNLRPANDGSMRFHERLGFRGVGTQDTEDGAKSVRMMIRELAVG